MDVSLKDVFGISRNVLKSYVDRQQIDEAYGSSHRNIW